MSLRAASYAFLIGAISSGAIVLGSAGAAERAGAPPPPGGAGSEFPIASEVRLGGDDSQTRMVVDFSRKIDIRAFTLGNPYRVVIDMPQVTFQFRARTGEAGPGLIKAFRFGLVMQ